MRLYFLRHGVAVEPAEWTGRDYERPLTREGIARMEREARAIAELSLDLGAIVTSPLERARQTAEIVASRLKLRDALVIDDRLAGGFDVESCRAIAADHADARALMLVGHEPAFSVTAGRLAGGASIEIKKGALAGIELSGPSATRGTLFCLIPPKVLAALGKA
ncbi:MAG TPA: histidine phosphatase family protein [Candidatus Cybelea sp.]|jgi:phosphohistidine phosphatase SixA|nr:histidine phosphatase family protein [Candidatus Cybelea sp.]